MNTPTIQNHFEDYEPILGLLATQASLHSEYSISLLEVSSRQILLKRARSKRDAASNNNEEIYYGIAACFYSEGNPDDLKVLAGIYQGTEQHAQAQALMHAASKVELSINRLQIEKKEVNPIEKKTDKHDFVSALKWKKEDIRDTPDMPQEEKIYLAEKLKDTYYFLEYGSGGSTLLASTMNIPVIYSVDSDKSFLEAVEEKVHSQNTTSTLIFCWVDIGPTGHYGNPTDFSKATKFPNYCISPWKRIRESDHSPSLILIDGRFRVACFLASLVFSKPGTVILFDDYADREHYHVVEEFLKPIKMVGRMAEFRVDVPILESKLLIELISSVSLHG